MTIQEAIKSGKPFKRPTHTVWMLTFQNSIFFELPNDELIGNTYAIRKEAYQPVGLQNSAILATDWEVKP